MLTGFKTAPRRPARCLACELSGAEPGAEGQGAVLKNVGGSLGKMRGKERIKMVT
jgi:hypothetical protein